MTFLWDGGDGEEPALTLDLIDIDLLLHLLDNYREQPGAITPLWPDTDDLSRVGGWLARWRRAQSEWDEAAQREEAPLADVDPLAESPF